jgi:hypothetical protein
MDIRQLRYVDKEKTKELRDRNDGRPRDQWGRLISVFETRWTRGVPPVRAFSQGDIFYRPREVRNLKWGAALKIITHSISVKSSQADSDFGTGGWVEFEVSTYAKSKVVSSFIVKLSQADFELVLKTGDLPPLDSP